jgi:Glycosyl transferase family 2
VRAAPRPRSFIAGIIPDTIGAGMRAILAPPHGALSRADSPSISVLVSAYQAAQTIPETIASLLAQTVAAHEIVVCDDGSTDDLDGALSPFRDRIRLIRKANGGGASALNAGAAAATGEFVAICDSDDVYEPERLEALSELGRARSDLDILVTDAQLVREGSVVGRFNRENPFPANDQRSAILERCFIFAPAVRRTKLLAIGGAEQRLRIAYDWDCWLRLIFAGARAGLVDEPLMRYRLRSGSLSDARVPALRERLEVLTRAAGQAGLTPAERRTLQMSRRHHGARWAEAAAEEAFARPGRSARRSLLRVAATRDAPPGRRLRCAAAVAMPARWWPRHELGGRLGGRAPDEP